MIVEIVKNFFSVLAYFFNPKLREQRDRKADWKAFKKLEAEYRKALADKDPIKASEKAKAMKELRAEYKFVKKP